MGALLAPLVVRPKIKWLWRLHFCPVLSIALQVEAELYWQDEVVKTISVFETLPAKSQLFHERLQYVNYYESNSKNGNGKNVL